MVNERFFLVLMRLTLFILDYSDHDTCLRLVLRIISSSDAIYERLYIWIDDVSDEISRKCNLFHGYDAKSELRK